ncbi:hypothetical protein G4B88_010980 [Cannabis sativa]|uniref:Kinesin light chain n=1 Tax=Cannabis sativa TaxID=3483 RepID=A0A7J6HJV8_CANSA|nr:hypothetical protein G4B88_010980 [Cannabis sativa]
MQLEGKQNKALTVFKTTKGENHPSVGSVFVRLADLYNRTGKIRESKSYCENALRIYEKPMIGIPAKEIASGLSDIYTIYESMDELEQALKLLEKALKIYNDAPGQQSTIAGIEAQMGVLHYIGKLFGVATRCLYMWAYFLNVYLGLLPRNGQVRNLGSILYLNFLTFLANNVAIHY